MDKKSRELVMAKLYLKNKDYKMAEKSFNEYLALNPEDVSALKSLGQVYEQINKFNKAFEMYERCYLAEPDRTGVLLDICRILLIQGHSLDQENIDRRKWLNLAIKAFPSNPIVVNFKALLATLPPDEQTAIVQKEASTRQTNNLSNQASSESTLLKVLEKLTLIDKRLDKIEQMLAKPIVNATNPVNTTNPINPTIPVNTTNPVNTPKPVSSPSLFSANLKPATFTPSSLSFSANQPSLNTTPVSKSNEAVVKENAEKMLPKPPNSTIVFSDSRKEATASPNSFNFSSNQAFTPTTSAPFNLSTNLFSDGLKKFDSSSTFSTVPANTNTTPLFKSTIAEKDNMVLPKPSNTTNLFSNSLVNEASAATPSSFSFSANNQQATTTPTNSAPFNFSTNLFSESLKKFNVPNNFSFSAIPAPTNTTPMFKQTEVGDKENEEGDDQVVQNEELPIENFCEMKPIDYKTGEEDEEIVFEHRAKLFRFRDKEYKERGLGNIKVLKHKQTGKARLIMRRDGIGIVCLNCWDCKNVEQVRDSQIKFAGVDASDGTAEGTIFLVKFKLKDTAETFMNYLNTLFNESSPSANNSILSEQKNADTQQAAGSSDERPEVELIDPKLDNELVNKARELFLPDLFYHTLKNQEACEGCDGCEND